MAKHIDEQKKNTTKAKSLFQIKSGTPLPLGVRLQGDTVYFSVAVPGVKECKLNLYSKESKEQIESIVLNEERKVGSIFYIGIKNFEYSRYEYLYEANGKEFLDPYAKIISGRDIWGKSLSTEEQKLVRGGFYFETYDWEGDKPLKIEYSDLILYRLHVRGFTKEESSKVSYKGTFTGIKEKIPYLVDLGINAIEIMPAYEFDEIMKEQQFGGYSVTPTQHKINYWGYSKEGNYFAPKSAYASQGNNPNTEFKDLVKALHKYRIEIILEFYFAPGTKEQLILDCLRFWVSEYHIDGFKINQESISSRALGSDAFLRDTKLFGLTWNTQEIYGGDNSVEFKNLAEYNEGFMTSVRRFLKGDEEQVSEVAFRIKRNPEKHAVINYVTNTNGFTLMDLYSFDVKHNEENGEKGHDGTEYNHSWNCGLEGNTRRKKIHDIRRKQIKNAFILLLLSQGTPLILAGDEFCNSQNGNNNAYCQDNRISWLDWKQHEANKDIVEFVKELIRIRKAHPILHNQNELRGMDYASCGFPDISYHGSKSWYPDYSNYSRILGVMLCGRYAMKDKRHHDDTFYFAYNMHWEDHEFDLPKLTKGSSWNVFLDTSKNDNTLEKLENQKRYLVKARTIVLFIGLE